MKRGDKKLLINFVYCRPVGHVVEALKFAKGFYDANKNIKIHLILNKKSPTELVKACDWIKKVYAVDTQDVLKKKEKSDFLKKIPKNWDYIFADFRYLKEHDEPDLGNFHNVSKSIFKARLYYGNIWDKKGYPKDLKYTPDSKVMLKLPKKALEYAKKFNHSGTKICIMLAGSGGPEAYPPIESWIKIVESIKKKIPNVKIYLTGVRKSKGGRTATLAYSSKELQRVLQIDNVVDCYDIELWNQLALIKKCDVFIAPHTGFAFLAPCVGTPWLAISGGYWQEYIFNRIPFYSVLPNVKDYPRYASKKKLKLRKGEKIPEMKPEKIEKKISDIIKGIKLLLDKSFTYEKAIKSHIKKIKESKTIKDAYFSFDGVLKF